ncbi:MAG: exodeoxyribonuclease III [Dehalococcoidia bacterium]|nr:MAG: exodeoxyribonuclease III [Dehalococcoidia bacterium]
MTTGSPKEIRLLSWNVNGIRAVKVRGFLDWLKRDIPDVLCLQETKATPEQLEPELRQPEGYHTYWNHPERKGYGGVATMSRLEPRRVALKLGNEILDAEGRVILTEHPGFILLNVYFPNGKKDASRLKYKMDFYREFLAYADTLVSKGEKLVVCGDYNTAHKEIDLARPKANEKISGFLPEERAWLDELVAHGYSDTFRHFNREPGQYSWWDIKTGARARNVGWRIDYFFISNNLLPALQSAFILSGVTGSDHCPVGIVLRI